MIPILHTLTHTANADLGPWLVVDKIIQLNDPMYVHLDGMCGMLA